MTIERKITFTYFDNHIVSLLFVVINVILIIILIVTYPTWCWWCRLFDVVLFSLHGLAEPSLNAGAQTNNLTGCNRGQSQAAFPNIIIQDVFIQSLYPVVNDYKSDSCQIAESPVMSQVRSLRSIGHLDVLQLHKDSLPHLRDVCDIHVSRCTHA